MVAETMTQALVASAMINDFIGSPRRIIPSASRGLGRLTRSNTRTVTSSRRAWSFRPSCSRRVVTKRRLVDELAASDVSASASTASSSQSCPRDRSIDAHSILGSDGTPSSVIRMPLTSNTIARTVTSMSMRDRSISRRPAASATAMCRAVSRDHPTRQAANCIRAGRNPAPSCNRETTGGDRNSPAR
jgi:hypothetical protein